MPSVSIAAMFCSRPLICATWPDAVRVIEAQLIASSVSAQRPRRTSAPIG